MKIAQTNRRKSQQGISLIEVLGSVIILAITTIGVAQFLFVTKTLAYHSNVKNAIIQYLNDTVTDQQTGPNGTNYLSVPSELGPFIPSGTITIIKNSTNITGSVLWTSTLDQDDLSHRFTNTLSLELLPPP